MSWQGAFIAATIGGLVAGLLSLLIQRWRYTVDQWSSRTTELCADIVKLADGAAEFWLKDRKKDDAGPAAELNRIRGGLLRLEALQIPFQSWCMRNDAIQLEKRIGKFANAISGGDFLKPTRKADLNRALEIQATAAELISHLHNCRIAASSLRATVVRVV